MACDCSLTRSDPLCDSALQSAWLELGEACALNDLIVSTCASDMHVDDGSSEVDLDSDDEWELVTRPLVPLCATLMLFFYDPQDTGEVCPLLPAEHLEPSSDYEVDFSVGTMVVCSSKHRGEIHAAKAPSEGIIVDVRACSDDEPQLLRLFGARLRTGTVGRVCVIPGCSDAFCEVLHGGQSRAELAPLGQVVDELRDLAERKRNAELVQYQRQVCSMMLGSQRRRMLGLPSV